MFDKEILQILSNYNLHGEITELSKYGHGRTNHTFKIKVVDKDNKNRYYLFQKINNEVFKDVDNLMKNIELVTNHIKEKIILTSNDVKRKVLNIVKTKTDKLFVCHNNNYYRIYDFIENSVCFETTKDKKLLYKTGKAFGEFQNQLKDFNSNLLATTIPNFHNTKLRVETFLETVNQNQFGRNENAKKQIEFVFNNKSISTKIIDMIDNYQIPLRVVHNDTKLNNIVFDNKTLNPLAVLDLDTVMPGAVCFDFGDAIRYVCNSCNEDRTINNKVKFDLKLFESFTKGFLEEVKHTLTKKEIDSLVDGCLVITFELAVRFLTDYLQHDKYFRTEYESQNLDRANVQFKLFIEMQKHEKEMREIVEKYSNNNQILYDYIKDETLDGEQKQFNLMDCLQNFDNDFKL